MSRLWEHIAITGWGIISPIGIGVEAFTDGVRMRRSGRKRIAGYPEGYLPFDEACVVPEFEASKFLGPKGIRFMDRTTMLAVAAGRMALQHSGIAVSSDNQARIGVVLGTNVGSIRSISDFIRDTLVRERPYSVNPMHFPNIVMNCAASQTAIWHKLKGVNTTVSGGRLAGLLALRYACLTINLGYADTLLTGSVEEFCEQTAWGFYRAGRVRPKEDVLLGEGCALFTVENLQHANAAGRKVLAEVLACEVGVYPPDSSGRAQQAEGLAACIRRAMDRAAVAPEDIWAVSAHQFADPELEDVEAQGSTLGLADHNPTHHVVISHQVGECFSAAGSFQLAALLALFTIEPDKGGRIALITSVAHSGAVGCALIREG